MSTLYSTLDDPAPRSATARRRSRELQMDSVFVLTKQLRHRQQNLSLSRKTYTLDLGLCLAHAPSKPARVKKGRPLLPPRVQDHCPDVFIQGTPISCLVKARRLNSRQARQSLRGR